VYTMPELIIFGSFLSFAGLKMAENISIRYRWQIKTNKSTN